MLPPSFALGKLEKLSGPALCVRYQLRTPLGVRKIKLTSGEVNAELEKN